MTTSERLRAATAHVVTGNPQTQEGRETDEQSNGSSSTDVCPLPSADSFITMRKH